VPFRDRERQRELRALAAGQRARPLPPIETQLVHPLGRALRVPTGIEACPHLQVLPDGEPRIGRAVLGEEADRRQLGRPRAGPGAQYPDAAGARLEQADGEMQQGALTGAVRPDEAYHASGWD
jgi:hypothetical protein